MVNYDITAVIKAQDKASNTLNKVGKSTSALSNQFSKLGTAASVAGGMIVAQLATRAAGAISGFFTDSVGLFTEFEATMATVTTLMGDGEDAMEMFGQELKNMAEEIPVDGVNDLAKGMFQVLSAGVKAGKATEFLAVAAKAAKAGVTDTFTAVDGLTTVLNAYQLSVDDATALSDIFFATAKAGKTTFPELSAAMSTVIPTAAAMGVEFSEIGAAMATLTAGGLSTAESGTSLNSVMIAMLKPSTDMKKAFAEIGFESGEAMLGSLGLAGSMAELAKFIDAGKASATELFPRVEALKAIFPLTGAQAIRFSENLKLTANAAGSMEAAFAISVETTTSKLQLMENEIDNTQILIGEGLIPITLEYNRILANTVGFIGDMMDKQGDANDRMQEARDRFNGLNVEINNTTSAITDTSRELPTLGERITDVFDILEDTSPTGEAFLTFLGDIGTGLHDAGVSTRDYITGAGKEFGDWLTDGAGWDAWDKGIEDSFNAGIESITSSVSDFITGQGNDFWDWMFDTQNKAEELRSELKGKFERGMEGAGKAITDFINNPAKILTDWISNAINGLLEFLRLKTIAAETPQQPQTTAPVTPIGNIPGIASGGFIQKSGVAVVHRGEQVVAAKNVGKGGLTIIFQGPVFGMDDFERQVNKAVSRNVKLGIGR